MSHETEGLSPLAAYEELMHFAKHRGESAVRLAMHAAVPQGFQPELLHLLQRNFVPEAGDDPVLEADILFSPLCEELGRGFFQFDPQVRTLLLENLASNYTAEPESRIAKVADFLLAYVDHHDRSTSGPQDQLWRDYLEMQRWVAYAFVDPAGAAQQLAAALENTSASNDFVARIQLGGLASALATPLGGFASLLNYAEGLQALELGDRKRAEEFFESVQEDEIRIGTVTLRSASQVLDEWQSRHPEYVAPREHKHHATFHDLQETIHVLLRYNDPTVRRRAAKSLGQPDAPEEAVNALIDSLNDRSPAVREASVHALAQIRTQPALLGLANALSSLSAKLQRTVLSRLNQMEQRLALVTSSVDVRKDVSDVIYETLRSRGYLPVFWSLDQISNLKSSEIVQAFDFVIADVSESRRIVPELEDILRLSMPVQPIAQGGTRVPAMFADLQQRYPALMRTIVYDTVSTFSVMLDRNMSALVSKIPPKPGTFEYDVFISFSGPDRLHVQTMSGFLSLDLTSFLGREPRIFMETDSVMSGYFDNEKILEMINKSAVFIVVISSNALESGWFRTELEGIESATGLQANHKSRIFKVLMEPVSFEKQPSSLRDLSGYNFFETDSLTGRVTQSTFGPTGPHRQRFFEVIENLARDIAQVRNEQSVPGRSEIVSGQEERLAIERWPVRTGTDRDFAKVKLDPVMTTVEELIAQPRPGDMPLFGKAPVKYQSGRAEPVETTTWSFDAEVRGFRRSANRTYRLILVGKSGATMIAKLPDPKRMRQSSPWLSSVVALRKRLEERLRFTNAYKYLHPPQPVHLVGIGHFGRPHGQAGAAPNGVELQPIIGFEWRVDEEDASQDLKLQSQGVVAMASQDEINHGQARINYELVEVDLNIIEALRNIVALIKIVTPSAGLKGLDFSRTEIAIAKADGIVRRIADIRPPGGEPPPDEDIYMS